jgi:hypothetical protein
MGQMMQYHKSDFSLVNVLSVVAFGLDELLSFKVKEVILDLESHTHGLSKSGQNLGLSLA